MIGVLDGCTPWPKEIEARYRRDGFWRGEALGDVLRSPAARSERIALATASSWWTFGDVDDHADRLASGLHQVGIGTHDRVVVQLPNSPEFVATTLALLRLGALPVFALPAHRASEIAYLADMSDAVAYIAADHHGGFDYRGLARDIADRRQLKHVLIAGDPGPFVGLAELLASPRDLPIPDPSDVAFFLLSGGTTGLPKLIPRTHDDYAYQLRTTVDALGVDENTIYLATLPVAHNAALGCPGVLGTLLAGGKSVLADSPAPDEVFRLIAREGVTLTTLMPPLVKLWVESSALFGVDVSAVLLQIGSAKLPIELARQIRPRLGCEMTHWFGMAEGLLTCTRLGDPDEVVFHTTGRPLSPADEIKVVDADGFELGPSQVGQLLTRGPYTFRGYYRAPEHNARSFTPDGFFRTGDLVQLTPDGNMIVEGRVKEVINRGGEKVSPAEVEDHLLAHPNVRDVALVGVPDTTLGEKTCACIIPNGEPPTLVELRRFLVQRGLANYKLPDRLALLEAFPFTRVGKVNKVELQHEIAARAPRAGRNLDDTVTAAAEEVPTSSAG